MKTLQAYKNDPVFREKFITELQWHQDQDKIVQGFYGEGSNGDFRGCAVGCAIHSLAKINSKTYASGNHQLLEKILDWPLELNHLIDAIFEGLPVADAKLFPLRVGKAIRAGADLKMVVPQWLYWILSDPQDGVLTRFDHKKFPDCASAITGVIALQEKLLAGEIITGSQWDAAYAAADAAARAAYAAYAADAAYAAYAADAARAADAADAARAAAYAARAADAAYAAYAADAAADAARAADAAARAALRIRQADKLIELLEAA